MNITELTMSMRNVTHKNVPLVLHFNNGIKTMFF